MKVLMEAGVGIWVVIAALLVVLVHIEVIREEGVRVWLVTVVLVVMVVIVETITLIIVVLHRSIIRCCNSWSNNLCKSNSISNNGSIGIISGHSSSFSSNRGSRGTRSRSKGISGYSGTIRSNSRSGERWSSCNWVTVSVVRALVGIKVILEAAGVILEGVVVGEGTVA